VIPTRGRPRKRPVGFRSRWSGARATACAVVLVAVPLPACSAPVSQAIEGPVAQQVQAALEGGTATFDHSIWDELLRGGAREGLVDYQYMIDNRNLLDVYLGQIAAANLASLAADELMAFLINAYNAITVAAILDDWGVSSIREIDGVWTGRTWNVGGHRLTLDNIEHNVLRPFWRDPRIHFAVNCASMSCAPLPNWAFNGTELESQLEERSRSFLTDPTNVTLRNGRLYLSSYFDWYGTDFTEQGWTPRAETIPRFIAMYATEEVRAAVAANPGIRVEIVDYDWDLNQAPGGTGQEPEPRQLQAGLVPFPFGGGTDQDSQESGASGKEASERGWLGQKVDALGEWVTNLGWLGPVVYALIYAVLVVCLIPASLMTIGAGVAFGFGLGTATVVAGANLGANLAFLVARYLLRSRVEKWLSGRKRLQAVDRAVEKQGWRVIVLTRLSPAFPFNVQNYFYGLTKAKHRHYLASSLVAMLPGTMLYVYFGAAGAEVAAAAGGAADWGQTALLVAGLVATVLVVALVTRTARRELNKALEEAGGTDETAGAGA